MCGKFPAEPFYVYWYKINSAYVSLGAVDMLITLSKPVKIKGFPL